MAQIYLLSIMANIIAGLTLSSDYLGKKMALFSGFKVFRENRVSEIVVGLAAASIGILKLIVRSPGEGIPVVGDLLPALAGIGLGLILLGEAFGHKVESENESIGKASRTALTYRVPVGIGGVVIAILHFFLPAIVLL